MDIMRHKDAVDDIVKASEVIMNSKDEAEKQALRVNKGKYIKNFILSCVQQRLRTKMTVVSYR